MVKRFMWLFSEKDIKEDEDPFESLCTVYFSMPTSHDYTIKGSGETSRSHKQDRKKAYVEYLSIKSKEQIGIVTLIQQKTSKKQVAWDINSLSCWTDKMHFKMIDQKRSSKLTVPIEIGHNESFLNYHQRVLHKKKLLKSCGRNDDSNIWKGYRELQ